jgi:N-acetylglucosamine malate deacetylase 1
MSAGWSPDMDYARRSFLELLGAGAISAAAGDAGQVVGQPAAGDVPSSAVPPANVMAIAAHPGDAFFAMGAPVALAVKLGGRGVFLSLSLGERGSLSVAPAQYGTLQREASERAAQMLGAQTALLTYADSEIPINDEAKFAVCDLIRQYKPTVVLTHWKGSWHKDHRACHDIVEDAAFYASLPTLVRTAPAHAVTRVFYANNWEDAEGFRTDAYLDVTPAFDRWLEACAVFPMWRGENGFRYNDYYHSLAVENGCLSGSQYAVALMSPAGQHVRRLSSL